MSFQPKEEKEAERQLIKYFAKKIGAEVIKLQEDIDDGGTDGVIELNDKKYSVEARRKGYPNHKGKSFFFNKGWETKCLSNGIFINELTIRKYKDKSFIFLVEIKGSEPKACFINKSRLNELLEQPYKTMKSTNSGVTQSVKTVPLKWFKKI